MHLLFQATRRGNRQAHGSLARPKGVWYHGGESSTITSPAIKFKDRAVMAVYGFNVGMTESECVEKLFKRHQALVEKTETTPCPEDLP